MNKNEDTLNNQISSRENEQFRHLMDHFWSEDVFRKKTLAQIEKDFALSGILIQREAFRYKSVAIKRTLGPYHS